FIGSTDTTTQGTFLTSGYGWRISAGRAGTEPMNFYMTYPSVGDYNFGTIFTTAGQLFLLGVSAGTSSASGYKNGSLLTSLSVGTPNVGSSIFNFGSDNVNYLHGYLSNVLLWKRVLSAAEHKLLAGNPWQLFQPLARRLWVNAQAAAGGPILMAQACL